MRYVILREPTVSDLQRAVEDFLRQGWTPQGGLAVDSYVDAGEVRFYQVMVYDAPQFKQT